VEACFKALEVVDFDGDKFGWLHDDDSEYVVIVILIVGFRNIIVIVEMIGNLKVKVRGGREEASRRIKT